MIAVVLVATACSSHSNASGPTTRATTAPAPPTTTRPIPATPTRSTCALNIATVAITGTDGTASAIGWAGNSQGVVTCLGGSFFVQSGINRAFGFGIYAGEKTAWSDTDGYLPEQITKFRRGGAHVAIIEFADRLVVGGAPFVAVYARVKVQNPTGSAIEADPQPTPGLIPLTHASNRVAAGGSAVQDYVVATDRFGATTAWPSATALVAAGGFMRHEQHMLDFWNTQLKTIAEIAVPDHRLDAAYRAGFVYTEIARSGTHLNTGVNGYEAEFSHDVVGILATRFTQGDFAGAHALLLEARDAIASQGQYEDGFWTYSWPWAIYLMKTGGLAFTRANFAGIESDAHRIATDRTGPGGIIGATNDIDSNGDWTVDDEEALTGLAAYAYVARRVGNATEAEWAGAQYRDLLAAMNRTLDATIARNHLDYVPCSMVQPNSANRCKNPQDANWAAPFLFGRWAWDAARFGAPIDGPAARLIDATYTYGFDRLKGVLPPDTFGGYPGDYYSTAYNAGYGSGGLASAHHRDQGIRSYEFMIEHTQSGPYSWWESSSAPSAVTPWIGDHPSAGQGSSPHAWGIANANKVLLDSLVAQDSDGTLLVGRGVPDAWLGHGDTIEVANFPTMNGQRVTLRISANDRTVVESLTGARPSGAILVQLPGFVGNVASASAGTIDDATGTVRVPAATRTVTIRLKRAPA
jgi:hypothetical protein